MVPPESLEAFWLFSSFLLRCCWVGTCCCHSLLQLRQTQMSVLNTWSFVWTRLLALVSFYFLDLVEHTAAIVELCYVTRIRLERKETLISLFSLVWFGQNLWIVHFFILFKSILSCILSICPFDGFPLSHVDAFYFKIKRPGHVGSKWDRNKQWLCVYNLPWPRFQFKWERSGRCPATRLMEHVAAQSHITAAHPQPTCQWIKMPPALSVPICLSIADFHQS